MTITHQEVANLLRKALLKKYRGRLFNEKHHVVDIDVKVQSGEYYGEYYDDMAGGGYEFDTIKIFMTTRIGRSSRTKRHRLYL